MPSVTLDWLAKRFEYSDFIKIYIEGAAALALRGGSRIFQHVRPTVLIECSSENQDFVTDYFHKYGYALYDASFLSGLKPIGQATTNKIAIPDHRQSKL